MFNEEYDLFKEMLRDDIKNIKAFFSSPKSVVTAAEFVTRLLPLVLFIALGIIMSNKPNPLAGLIIVCVPLAAVAGWAVVNRIAVKRFGLNV